MHLCLIVSRLARAVPALELGPAIFDLQFSGSVLCVFLLVNLGFLSVSVQSTVNYLVIFISEMSVCSGMLNSFFAGC